MFLLTLCSIGATLASASVKVSMCFTYRDRHTAQLAYTCGDTRIPICLFNTTSALLLSLDSKIDRNGVNSDDVLNTVMTILTMMMVLSSDDIVNNDDGVKL